MQAKTLGLGVVVALSSLPLSGKIAQASNCQKFTSYIQLPQGECVNLAYMTTLGNSRSRVQAAARAYDRAVTASSYDFVTATVTQPIGNSNASYIYATSYPLTAAERQWLQKRAAQKGREYLTASAANKRVEDWAYNQHLKAMGKVSRTFAAPRAEYTDRLYIQSSR
jgi:PPE-repeat protein